MGHSRLLPQTLATTIDTINTIIIERATTARTVTAQGIIVLAASIFIAAWIGSLTVTTGKQKMVFFHFRHSYRISFIDIFAARKIFPSHCSLNIQEPGYAL